ncbi:MAG: exodeoxyribonuclease I [Spirochaetales bacterium]|jgi:exodeoxyribonuclease-1|nr:exodeoxyribonuclease I [Spirochaetales bacterium]
MSKKSTAPSIYWYDVETFGLDSRYDRLAQFAGQRTDLELRPIGEPLVLYVRLSDDYLPDPLSCTITSITPQMVNMNGMTEAEAIKRINAEFSRPNTTVAGFNNIRFDDEFIRNALYRNFHDPYRREWDWGNSRWDIIDLIRATYDLRPEGIRWPAPKEETGNPTFRLTSLTEANDIEQEGAHDALVDVRATIAMARLIREKQPRLYDWSFNLRSKARVKQLAKTPFGEPVLYTSPMFTSRQGCSRLITPITHMKSNANAIICFDLSKDIFPLLSADADQLLKVDGVFILSINKCPMLSPLSVLTDELAVKLGIEKAEALMRHAALVERPELLLKGRSIDESYEGVDDVDFMLYDGFFGDADQRRFETIRATDPKEKLSLNLPFEDRRVKDLLFRHVARNWPEALNENERSRWKSFCANRILNPPGTIKMNLAFYKRKIAERLESVETEAAEKLILTELKQYGEELEKRIFS